MTKDCRSCFYADFSGNETPCSTCSRYDKWVSVDAYVEPEFVPLQYDPRDVAFKKKEASPLDVQVSGNHYKKHGIQPVEYIHTNNIGYFEGNVIKYVTRWRDKGGVADLEKAKHYIDLLIELEGKKHDQGNNDN